MCGIVGYVGERSAADILLRGLKRLEYRGYDSAGVAFLLDKNIEIKKSQGKLENVEKLLNGDAKRFQASTCGIGHTRWATHGKPTTQNAHPHRADHVVLVHNGIIENYQEIKKNLLSMGYKPLSETDSELFGFLVQDAMDKRGLGLVDAVRESFRKLEGQCSVVVMSEREPGVVVGVRNGSPLVAAVDPQGGAVVASDAQPLIEINRDVVFLEHGDLVVGTKAGLRIYSLSTGEPIHRDPVRLDWSVEKLDKQGFEHYMLKEIHEQPAALVDTLNGVLDRVRTDPFPLADQPGVKILDEAKELVLIACGTSWHAALVAKYWIEQWAKIPVSVDLASEFRYRAPVLRPGAVVIGVSQSGETADTLAVIRDVKKQGIPAIGIANVRGCSLSREADAMFYTSAGPEIGVAATKTFTSQMLLLLLTAGYLAVKKKQIPHAEVVRLFDDMIKLPHVISNSLDRGSEMMKSIHKAVTPLSRMKGFFFIGRGYAFPIALEGALKLKEIAYVHAEGYAAGELKHGPIAMIDEGMAVVVLAPRDTWRDKTVSNLEEVKARGATIVGVGEAGDQALESLCDHWIPLHGDSQALDRGLMPFLMSVVVQLLSYELACRKGTDVDKPRNLAKSVTVE